MQARRQKPDEWSDDGVGEGRRIAHRAFDRPPIGDEDDGVQVGLSPKCRPEKVGDGTRDLGPRRWVAGGSIDDRDDSFGLDPVLDDVGDEPAERVHSLRSPRPNSDDRGGPVDRCSSEVISLLDLERTGELMAFEVWIDVGDHDRVGAPQALERGVDGTRT
jgi:hypothetical protein